MNKLKSLIKENLNQYVDRIIKESNIDVLEVAKNEFLTALQNNPLTLSVGRGEAELPSNNFTFYIDYVLESEAYYERGGGSYDEEPWSETYNEDKFNLTHFNVTAIDEESGMEVKFIPDEDMYQLIKQSVTVDYSNYDDMPSKQDYFNEY